MKNVPYFILLVPLFPLIGAFANQIVAMVLTGVAWAVLLGSLMNLGDDSQRMLLLAQIPFLVLVSFLSIRMSRKGRTQGRSDTLLTEEEKRFKEMEAKHKAIKAAVLEEEKEEVQSLAIYGAAKGLAESLSWKDMAPRLTASIQKIFGGYEFLLFAFDQDSHRSLLHRRGSWSRDFPLEGDVANQPAMVYPPQTSEVIPVLAVPIMTGEGEQRRRNGLLILKKPREDQGDQYFVDIGREFGEQLGMALEKAQLFSQMEIHSRVDGLTRVLRRQAFMERLDQEFRRAAVFQTPFSLMMVDIDHFKAINDSHGHEAGDVVLRRIGDLLKETIYETDVIGRYGGEEFILLLPKAQKDGVLRKAEQLRQRIESEIIPFGFEKLRFTVSIGVAHFPASGDKADELIAAADKALYQAKEHGRNQVVEG